MSMAPKDLAIVAGLLLAGVLYLAVYLRPRRTTHCILLDPPDGEQGGVDADWAPVQRWTVTDGASPLALR
jgi:hypothetical protein